MLRPPDFAKGAPFRSVCSVLLALRQFLVLSSHSYVTNGASAMDFVQFFILIVLPGPSNDTTSGNRGLGVACRCTALRPRVKSSISSDPLHSAGDDVRCQLQVKLAACGNPTAAAVGTVFRGGGSEVVEKRVKTVDFHVILSEGPHCVRVQVDCGGN